MKGGNPVQREAYRVLMEHRIMDRLARYDPVVAGTIPIGIDIPGSDIDILCCAGEFNGTEAVLRENFSVYPQFGCNRINQGTDPALVCSFWIEPFEIEIFAQHKPVREQNGFRHLLAEHALLELYGKDLRREIVSLKRTGLKTEPAFARALGLPGDPYEAILQKGRELGLY